MAAQKILVPCNFASSDQKALDFVIRTFANREDVEVTLFHVYAAVPEIEVRGSPIMEKMTASVGYLAQKLREKEEELKQVKNNLVMNGFSESRIQTTFEAKKKDTAGDIVDYAQKGSYNVVVLSRKPGKISRFFAGSVSNKVVTSLKGVAVCIVS